MPEKDSAKSAKAQAKQNRIVIPWWLLRLQSTESSDYDLSARELARELSRARIRATREVTSPIAILVYSCIAGMVSIDDIGCGSTSIEWFDAPGRAGSATIIARKIGASPRQVNRAKAYLLSVRLLEEDGVRLHFLAHKSMQRPEVPGSRICPLKHWPKHSYGLPAGVAKLPSIPANSKILYALYDSMAAKGRHRSEYPNGKIGGYLGVHPTRIPKLRKPLEARGLVWTWQTKYEATWVWTDHEAYLAWLREGEQPVQDISADDGSGHFGKPTPDISASLGLDISASPPRTKRQESM